MELGLTMAAVSRRFLFYMRRGGTLWVRYGSKSVRDHVLRVARETLPTEEGSGLLRRRRNTAAGLRGLFLCDGEEWAETSSRLKRSSVACAERELTGSWRGTELRERCASHREDEIAK